MIPLWRHLATLAAVQAGEWTAALILWPWWWIGDDR